MRPPIVLRLLCAFSLTIAALGCSKPTVFVDDVVLGVITVGETVPFEAVMRCEGGGVAKIRGVHACCGVEVIDYPGSISSGNAVLLHGQVHALWKDGPADWNIVVFVDDGTLEKISFKILARVCSTSSESTTTDWRTKDLGPATVSVLESTVFDNKVKNGDQEQASD